MKERRLGIKYFWTADDTDIYYEIHHKSRYLIKFVHRDITIIERALENEEIHQVRQLIEKIKLPLQLSGDTFGLVLPYIVSKIQIRTNNGKFEYLWDQIDRDENLDSFKDLEALIDYITELIDVDFSKLDMPMYE